MKDYKTEDIRNVVLIGHGGTGKTTLAEAMLFASGAVNRLGSVEDGTTTSDFDPDEIKRTISINLALLPCEWKNKKINIIDAPGYADFVGEMKAAIQAADAAVVLVDASSGVEVGTEHSWAFADETDLPRAVLIDRMDRENADFAQALAQVQSFFGKKCVALQIPVGAQSSFSGGVDVLAMKAYSGEKGTEGAVPDSLSDQAARLREQVVEAIAETDDELLTKYLDGTELTPEELTRGLRAGIASGAIVPVLAAAAAKNTGTTLLLDTIADYFPSPKDRPPVN
ncbi:MAG TPA: GTP-binding protein, partial [Dehalococcoidia bacterium]|nr:GTP-binding protein [Dehalococcoidia bacterium]